MQPPQAYSDGDTRLTLLGRDFVPATILDPLSGRRIATSDGFAARIGAAGQWTELSDLDWLSTGALAVSLPSAMAQRLPAAPLDVEITDPRGQVDVLEMYVPFSWYEPMWLENLGFAPEGEGWKMTESGATAKPNRLIIGIEAAGIMLRRRKAMRSKP